MFQVRGLSSALCCCPGTQLVVGRSGERGGRGASVFAASSGRVGEGPSQLLWVGFMTGEVIMRGGLDGWAGPMLSGHVGGRVGLMSSRDAAGLVGPVSSRDVAGWVGPMSSRDVAGWAGLMSSGDVVGWESSTFVSAVFSLSSMQSCNESREVGCEKREGVEGVAWATSGDSMCYL